MKFKICKQCNKKLSIDNFYQYNDKIYPRCKSCESQKKKLETLNFKQECLKYKNQYSCVECGYNDNIIALDFHHINPEEKDFLISKSKTLVLSQKTKQELDKCIVLCANCHRIKHSIDYNGMIVKKLINKIETFCVDCNNQCSNNCDRCKKCFKKHQRQNIPSKNDLINDINNLKYLTTIGRKYSVSDNAVKKWLKSYDLYTFYKNNKK